MEPSIRIPIPEHWSAAAVYRHLLKDTKKRRRIFKLVDEKRFLSTDSVFVTHESLPYPFLFSANVTDKIFIDRIKADYKALRNRN